MQTPIRGDAIQALHGRHAVWASCPKCRRSIKLDLGLLAKRFGWAWDVGELRSRLRCRACGARGQIRLSYEGRPAYGGALRSTDGATPVSLIHVRPLRQQVGRLDGAGVGADPQPPGLREL